MAGEIRVHYEPEHEVVTFDESDTPVLTYGRRDGHDGWTLWYLDDAGGVDDHFMPGDITDLDAIVAEAQAWLQLVREDKP